MEIQQVKLNCAGSRGTFTAISAYIRREEKSQINNLGSALKEQNEPKTNRRKEIIKVREEKNEIENRKRRKAHQNEELAP